MRIARKLVLLLSAIFLTISIDPMAGQKQVKADELQHVKETNDTKEDLGHYGQELYMVAGIDYRYDNEAENSDTMIIVQLDHTNKQIKLISLYRDTYLKIDDGYYFKANAAYNRDGADGMLSMVKRNLDLDIEKYATVNFVAVQKAIDAFDGIDVEVTKEEAEWINKYNGETSAACGVKYRTIPEEAGTYHLNGTQALSYARIRYTKGLDFERTERQRTVISKLLEKARKANPYELASVVREVYPELTTNVGVFDAVKLAKAVAKYDIVESKGFPFKKTTGMVGAASVVFAKDLEKNVYQLHELLGDINYVSSEEVTEISNYVDSLMY